MMKRQSIAWAWAMMASLALVLVGCHAKDDDPAGQAEELADPVRREHAIDNLQRLYSSAIAAAEGDRSVETVQNSDGKDVPGPTAITNAAIGPMVNVYTANPDDERNGRKILDLLVEMQDTRGIPAFLAALEWRSGVTEEHAIRAAAAIERMDVPEDQMQPVVDALSTALERVEGDGGDANRMRIGFIRALGSTGSQLAAPALTRIATRVREDQSFLINRMAGEHLGALRDPEAVDPMIRALFLFGNNQPGQRMNDIAAEALVQIGRPAYAPLVALLHGENATANRIAQNYIAAIGRADAHAAEKMDPETTVIEEACFSLGQLGFREAIDPMLEQIQPVLDMSVADANDESGMEDNRQRFSRSITCATSLVQLNRSDADTPRLRDTLVGIYRRIPEGFPPAYPGQPRAQLLAAMQHTYDPGLLDFLYEVSSDRDQLPDSRVIALRSAAYLANASESTRFRAVVEREPQGQIRTLFDQVVPALDTAGECDEDLACYRGKLGDSNADVVRKGAYMVARYARGNAEVLAELIEHIDHTSTPVRGDVLYAIDWIATDGSPEAIAEIDRVRGVEEGRSSWNQIKSLAMAVRARLLTRS